MGVAQAGREALKPEDLARLLLQFVESDSTGQLRDLPHGVGEFEWADVLGEPILRRIASELLPLLLVDPVGPIEPVRVRRPTPDFENAVDPRLGDARETVGVGGPTDAPTVPTCTQRGALLPTVPGLLTLFRPVSMGLYLPLVLRAGH